MLRDLKLDVARDWKLWIKKRRERREHNVTPHHDLWAVIRWAGKLFGEKLFVKYQQIDAGGMLCSKVAFYIFRNIEFHPDNLDLIVFVPVVRFKGKT